MTRFLTSPRKLRISWLAALSIASIVLSVFSFSLAFSELPRFQVFLANHPMERFDQHLRWKFDMGGAEVRNVTFAITRRPFKF